MPTAGSNFSRYPIPSDLTPEGICCMCASVPNDPEWRAMFLGALWRLSLQTHWERDGAGSAKIVAAKWREIWQGAVDMSCGCDNPSITNVTINSQLVQNMQLALQWQQIWLDASSTVSLAYYQIPDTFSTDAGDAGDEIEQRLEALCLAIQGWTNEVMNYMESWMIANVEEVAAVAGVAFIGIAGISGLLMWPLAIGWAGVVNLMIEAFQELRSTVYREYIQCRMYENLLGKNPDSRADFEASLTADPVGRPQPETVFQNVARDAIETYLRGQLNNLDNYLMFAGQLGTAMDIAKSGAVACPCLDEFQHVWLGGFGDQTFAPSPAKFGDNCTGTYDPVLDRFDSCTPAVNSLAIINATVTLPSRTITRVAFRASWHGTRPPGLGVQRIYADDVIIKQISPIADDGTDIVVEWTGSLAMTKIEVESGVPNTSAGDGSFMFIDRIDVDGDGNDPF